MKQFKEFKQTVQNYGYAPVSLLLFAAAVRAANSGNPVRRKKATRIAAQIRAAGDPDALFFERPTARGVQEFVKCFMKTGWTEMQ